MRVAKRLDPFHLTVKESKRNGRKYGPYSRARDVLAGVPEEERFARGSYQYILKLNGGYGKNPEHGATVISNWTGPLSDVLGMVDVFLMYHFGERQTLEGFAKAVPVGSCSMDCLCGATCGLSPGHEGECDCGGHGP